MKFTTKKNYMGAGYDGYQVTLSFYELEEIAYHLAPHTTKSKTAATFVQKYEKIYEELKNN